MNETEKDQNFLQYLNEFLGTLSRGVSRFDPRMLVAGSPQSASGVFAPEEQQLRSLKDPSQMVVKGAMPDDQSMAGAGRALMGLMDSPGSTEFADFGQSTVEGMPRIAAAAAGEWPVLASDMILQGYAGAKDAGLSGWQAAGAGGVGGVMAGLMAPFGAAGRNIAAEGMARFLPGIENAVMQRAGEAVGSNAAMMIPQLTQRPATQLVTGQEVTPYTEKELLETGLSNIALAPLSVREVMETPKVVGPDGNTIEYPSATELQKVQITQQRAAAQKAQTTDAMASLYSQFMADAQNTVSPIEGGIIGPVSPETVSSRVAGKVRDATKDLTLEERQALSPLGLLRPIYDSPVAQAAHDSFIEAAGLKTDAEAMLRKDVMGVASDKGPTQPLFSVDYGAKDVPPALLLDRIITGEIKPTGSEGQDIQVADLLRRAFAPNQLGGEDFVNMDRVNDLVALAGRVSTRTATPEDVSKWETLAPESASGFKDRTMQEAALLAAKILQDPATVLGAQPEGGLDPNRWTTDRDYLKTIHNTAGTMYKRWESKIIETPEDAGALVRDVNFFLENIRGFLDQQGFSQASVEQLSERAGFKLVTRENINEQYNKAAEQYLDSPDAESAANTLQWVKNKILIAAKDAKDFLTKSMESVGMADPDLALPDKGLDTRFKAMLDKTTPNFKRLLSDLYVMHRRESMLTDQARWSLDRFRKETTQFVDKLTPEQAAQLDKLPNPFEGLNPEYVELYLKGDKEAIERRFRETDSYTEEELAADPSLADTEIKFKSRAKRELDPASERAAYEETIKKFKEAQAKVEPILKDIKLVIEREKEERYTEGGEVKKRYKLEPVQVNAYDLLFKRHFEINKSLENRMGGASVISADAQRDATFRSEEERIRAQVATDLSEAPTSETRPKSEIDALAATEENPLMKRDNPLVSKYFDGTPQDPYTVLQGMDRITLESALDAIYAKPGQSESATLKNLRNKYALEKGITPNEAKRSEDFTQWLKSFLEADFTDPGSPQRQAWIKDNPVTYGKTEDWSNLRRVMLGTEKGKYILLSGRLMGLTPKPGITPESLQQASMSERKSGKTSRTQKVSAKFEYDVQAAFQRYFLETGYQPELAQVLSNTLSKMTKNFTWLDNAEFAMLTDKKKTAEQFFKQLEVLGVHIPVNSMVGGKLVQNPIIGIVFNDFINNKDYAAFNGFLKVSTLAHEAFHAFKKSVVDNPEIHKLNEDSQAQVEAFRQMEKLSQSLNPEERVRIASTLVDLMIPPKYTRDAKGQFRPEIKGIINGVTRDASEFMAFYYQIVATGLASKVANSNAGRGTNEVRDAMMWLSRDEQNFIRGQFRYVGDMLDTLQRTLEDPDYRRSQGYVTTEKEQRTVMPKPESQGRLQFHAEGQTTEVPPAKPGTKNVTSEFTKPATNRVGMAARQLAASAERIASPTRPDVAGSVVTDAEASQAVRLAKMREALDPYGKSLTSAAMSPQSLSERAQLERLRIAQAQKKGEISQLEKSAEEVRYPALMSQLKEAYKDLAKIDIRVAKAEATLKQLETSFGSTADVAEQLSTGPIKTIDIADLGDASEKFAAMWGFGGKTPPPTGNAVAEAGGFLGGEGPQKPFIQSVWMRFMAPLQYRMRDLSRRGLELGERARQIQDNVQPLAHRINHSIMDPVVKRFDNFESVRIDTTHDFFKFIADGNKTDPVARKALNKILAAQQKLGGLDVLDPQMQQVLQQELQTVPQHKRTLVTTAVRTVNEIYRNQARQQMHTALESQRNLIAATAMRMAPGKLTGADAKQLANEAIRVSELGDVGEYRRFQTQLAVLGMQPGQAETLGNIAATSYARIKDMQGRLEGLGNFASEQRVGQYGLAYTLGNKRYYEGIRDLKEGANRERELMQQGASNFRKIDKAELAEEAQMMNSYEGVEAVHSVVTDAFNKQVAAATALDPALGEWMRQTFNPVQALTEYAAVSSAQKNMMRRKLTPGRETVDYVETMFDNVSRTSVSLARRTTREEYNLVALELEQMGQTTLVKDLNKQLSEVMSPDSPLYAKFKTFTTAYHVATLANTMVEGVQMLSSGNSELYREGLSTPEIYKTWNTAIQNLASWHMDGRAGKLPQQKFKNLANLGAQIENSRYTATPMLENRDATVAYYLRRMNDEARMGHEAILAVGGEDLLQTNLARAARTNDFTFTDLPSLMGNGMYQMSRNLLRAYSIMPRMNNWLASSAALQVGYDKGLRGNELYSYAIGLKDAMTVSGGRANRPTAISYLGAGNKYMRPAVGLATMLSNYSLGMITIMGSGIKDAMAGAPGLRPEHRIAAGKSAANALAVQLSFAGALGLPMAGFGVWFLEQLFPSLDPEKRIREIAKFGFGEDFGNAVSDVAMNGWINKLTGADVAGKTGINSLFGINGYNGFDPAAIGGPSVSIVKDYVSALGSAVQGDGMEALTKVVPKGVRGLVDTVRSTREHGDLRFIDSSNNLFHKATKGETLSYALGFQPAALKRARQENRLVSSSERAYQAKNNRELDLVAKDLLRGDKRSLGQLLQDRMSDPNLDMKETIRSVVERAIDMEVEKDPTDTGARATMRQRGEVAGLFADGENKQERKRVALKIQMYEKLGNPLGLQVTQKDLLHAMVVDELRTQNKSMTRQEAVITANKLLGQ